MVLLSTHNICFDWEIRKIIVSYTLLSGGLYGVCQCTICWYLNVNNYECCQKYLKFVFKGSKNLQNVAEWPLTTDPNFGCNTYMTICLQNRITAGIFMMASCIQRQFWFADLVMWYYRMWQMNYGKIWKNYHLWNWLYPKGRRRTIILAWEFVTRSCLKLQNPCSNHEIHVLFEHGFYFKKPKLGPEMHAWC